jgi:hypothetical protein
MPTIHIERIDLAVRGVDPATVQAAIRVLPAALGRALAVRRDGGASGVAARPLGVSPSCDALAQAVARQVAAAVRGRAAEPRDGGES